MIATLQSLDPIFVDFLLPQQAVAQLTVGAKVEAKVDAFPDRVFTGKITAINPKIETASRNIQVRATLPNADQKLLPGMFATVQLETGAAQRLITLPQTAVSYNPYGSLVYLVDDKGKGADGKPQLVARQVFVTTGATRGDQVAILKGVAEGDMVVTAGQIKLRNGAPVIVNNARPADATIPTPTDRGPTESASKDSRMKFTDLFIRRPVLASVVSLLILVIGLRASARCRCCNIRAPRTPWSR